MYKEFVIKAIVPSYTVYLFNNEEKLIIPFQTNQWGAESLILSMQPQIGVRPHVHDTFKRMVTALEAQIAGALIYRVEEDIFYSYVRLLKNDEIFDVDARATDALSLALRTKTPILVSDEVFDKVGIKVTRELLERSLELGN